MGGLANLAVALAAGCILGLMALLIIHKMIDGEFPIAPGLAALVVDFVLIALSVISSSALIPGTVFVVALASMCLFPFAADQLDKADIRALDTDRLIRAYNAYAVRPDNISAVFEVAKMLYSHGMKGNAIGLATAALNSLSLKADPVSNRSLRDVFRTEEQLLKNWNREAMRNPAILRPVPCKACGYANPLECLTCQQCGAPYLLEAAGKMTNKKMLYGRLLLSFAVLAGVIVTAAEVGVAVSGAAGAVLLFLIILGAGGLLYKVFKGPSIY